MTYRLAYVFSAYTEKIAPSVYRTSAYNNDRYQSLPVRTKRKGALDKLQITLSWNREREKSESGREWQIQAARNTVTQRGSVLQVERGKDQTRANMTFLDKE